MLDRLSQALNERGVNLSEPEELANQVLKLSDFYLENPGKHTPWTEKFAAPAYLAYFQPLNFARLRSAWREMRRFIPSERISEVHDFGSGIGNTHWVLEDDADFDARPLICIERSVEALGVHHDLIESAPTRFTPKFQASTPKEGALAVFSYSFLEIKPSFHQLKNFSHLLIVEPSTREISRELLSSRDELMKMGFKPLAPCTHSEACPLLEHSNRDWCHQRIGYGGDPDWWERLEAYLPMKNRTLTYSYLVMSRAVEDTVWRGQTRVIGDTLVENGKTRQMICRGSNREFLAWLHKNGEPPRIPRGSLLRGVENAEVKAAGAELRPVPNSLQWEEPR